MATSNGRPSHTLYGDSWFTSRPCRSLHLICLPRTRDSSFLILRSGSRTPIAKNNTYTPSHCIIICDIKKPKTLTFIIYFINLSMVTNRYYTYIMYVNVWVCYELFSTFIIIYRYSMYKIHKIINLSYEYFHENIIS